MKKVVLIAAGILTMTGAFAQKSQIRSAKNYLGEKNFDKARAAIEQAINDESKDDPYAWYVRGTIFLAMQQEPANNDKDYYFEAGKSFKKAVELKSDYEKEDMNRKLYSVALYSFNNGIGAYNAQNYDKAYANFSNVVEIHDLEAGKRFTGKEWINFDTVSRQARLYQGYSAYYGNKYDEALPVLEQLKNDPVVSSPNVYLMIADIYDSKKDEGKLLSTLAEGRKAYPNEKVLLNRELNVYISTKRTEELVNKLQEAIKQNPTDANLLFTLGIAYDNMANPKNGDNDLPKPANYGELFSKAEETYLNTLKMEDKADYNYNLGALYFNRAVMLNDQMNAITGTSGEDLKKYDALKVERDQWFDKALPYFEKTVSTMEPNASTLKGDDKKTYQAALIAAKEIYARQNKMDKAGEYKKKLEAVN